MFAVYCSLYTVDCISVLYPKQAELRTLSNVERGAQPEFNINSVLREDWFGVWDTDITPQSVFSINLFSEIMR